MLTRAGRVIHSEIVNVVHAREAMRQEVSERCLGSMRTVLSDSYQFRSGSALMTDTEE